MPLIRTNSSNRIAFSRNDCENNIWIFLLAPLITNTLITTRFTSRRLDDVSAFGERRRLFGQLADHIDAAEFERLLVVDAAAQQQQQPAQPEPAYTQR